MNVYQHATNRFLASRLIPVALLAVIVAALFLFVGCNAPAVDTAKNTNTNDPAATAEDHVSTAMVLANDNGSLLMVDQSNETVYTTDVIDAMLYNADGQQISVSDLQPGNIVEVHGNGIMLESYPGQYPGITEVQVLEKGNPADVAKYQEIIDQVFAELTPTEKIGGYVQYRNDLADVTVALDPYSYIIEGSENTGSFEQDGKVLDDTPDISITEPTGVVLGFNDTIDTIVVKRTPVLTTSEPVTVNTDEAAWEVVPTSDEDSRSVSMTIEPGYLYRVTTAFSIGDADYAFYTQIVE